MPLVRERSANRREHAVRVEQAVACVSQLCRKPVSREFAIRLATSAVNTG